MSPFPARSKWHLASDCHSNAGFPEAHATAGRDVGQNTALPHFGGVSAPFQGDSGAPLASTLCGWGWRRAVGMILWPPRLMLNLVTPQPLGGKDLRALGVPRAHCRAEMVQNETTLFPARCRSALMPGQATGDGCELWSARGAFAFYQVMISFSPHGRWLTLHWAAWGWGFLHSGLCNVSFPFVMLKTGTLVSSLISLALWS